MQHPSTDFTLSAPAAQGGLVLGTAPTGTCALTLDGEVVRVASDGRFVMGFGRDAGASATLVATLPGGREVTRMLAVASRQWRIETFSSLPRFALPSAEFQRLRPDELRRIAAARAIDSGSEGWRQQFVWPVTGRVSGVFGSQRVYANGEKGDYHSGVDIARPEGTPVVAPADGVVVLAADRPFTLEGNLLIIDHGMGLNSAFLHLSQIDVKAGEHVARGQPVGRIGMTGRATGPHLHWAIKWRDRRLDPQAVLTVTAGR
ncbi:MAG: M23 family metallopeptidase [Sphingomonadaceae bacterium]|nr:M23 family metallopeptidase [Sphingomonadaceae bacterium]